ncbi:Macrolide export protein MacA [Sporomusa carbonis]|uniref:efflux RND transporter periplasmic adaptor subunit n=1 Tax=Sporomusa carbonis TaxID=3076075 RepID=UPI003A749F2E
MIWEKIRQYRKWLVIVAVLAGLAAGGAMYFKKSSTPVVAETTVTVGRGDVQAAVSATGTISAVNSVDISSRVTGLITEVRVKENDMVKAGQVLVVLDDTSIKAQVAQYQAQLANYAAIYERSKKLAAVGGESAQQLDADRTNYLVAQSTYNNYVSQLEYYVIRSPIDGMVVGKPTPAGQTVAQGISSPQVIMTIADMSQMQIKLLVDETDIGKVKAGQKVSFTVDAYTNKTFTGTVTSISKSATTSSNVVYYPVYVDINSPQGLLYPTMTARATINVGESKQALVVPLSAVKEEKGQKYVQLLVEGKPQSTPVQTGLSDDEKVEILSGLNEGDQIVLPAAKQRNTTSTRNQGPPPPI